jgi:hypothetical protein
VSKSPKNATRSRARLLPRRLLGVEDRRLGGTDRERRHRGDPGRQLEGRVDGRRGGHDPGDEPVRVRFLCGHRPAGRIISIARALPIALVSRWVPPAPGMTPSGSRAGRSFVLGGHDHVAGHRQLAASTQGEATDRGDERQPMAAIRSHVAEGTALGQRRRRLRSSSWMSAPAANARSPEPVMTIARQVGSPSSASGPYHQLVEKARS